MPSHPNKGTSNWLAALSLQRYGFNLTKAELKVDLALALRYGWQPKNFPPVFPSVHVESPSQSPIHYTVPREGIPTFVTMRYEAPLQTSWQKSACYDVELEPKLQPLEGESFDKKNTTTDDDARLDFKANGLWETRFIRGGCE